MPRLKSQLLSFISGHDSKVHEIEILKEFPRAKIGNIFTALRRLEQQGKIEVFFQNNNRVYRAKEKNPSLKSSS